MSQLKPKQWFLDRIGKRVVRDAHLRSDGARMDNKVHVSIKDELQAVYMFDMQNDLAAEGTYLNYRDEK